MTESAGRNDSGLVDLTNLSFDALGRIEEPRLTSWAARFLREIDNPSSSVGGHNS